MAAGRPRFVAAGVATGPGALELGKALALTTFEFSILRVLSERAGRVLAREQQLELVHGSADESFDRSIDVHVSRLRSKLGDDPRNPRLLKTVRGVGYMLAPNAQSASDV